MLFLFCYGRAGTNNVVKYNLKTEREEKQIGLAGSARKTSYQWGGYTQVDLAADEHGLWALWGYSSHSYKLRVRMIDVYTGTLTHAWHLNTGTTYALRGPWAKYKCLEIVTGLLELVRFINKLETIVITCQLVNSQHHPFLLQMRILCFKTEYLLILEAFVTQLNDYKWAYSLIILLRVSI